jgi:hypothetical protein
MNPIVFIERAASETATIQTQQQHARGRQGEPERGRQVRCRGVGNASKVSEACDSALGYHGLIRAQESVPLCGSKY